MRLGRPVLRPALLAPLALAPLLAGCGLFDSGSNAEEALEYLPADTFEVRFSDRGAMAERLGVDDIDPRDVSDGDVDDYVGALTDEEDRTAVATTELTDYVVTMKDAPLNDFDVEWEAVARWGDPEGSEGAATVWKVGDDVDFDALADDLEEKGYDKGETGGLTVFTGDQSLLDRQGPTIGGVYPATMFNVLLDEDEQVVVMAVAADSLDDVAAVITDDDDSLADDDGGMGELLDAADEDPELAWLAVDGASVCPAARGRIPAEQREDYDDLGRPEARALLVAGDDSDVVLALRYPSADAAEEDLEAREALVDDGVDPTTLEPYEDLGDFSVERDGDLLLIGMDYEDGPLRAVQTELRDGGPGMCAPAAG